MPNRHRAIINDLSKNKNIVILKQEKGRGIAILNRSKYIEKCLSLFDGNQFTELYHDPTNSVERKVQETLRKIKKKYLLESMSSRFLIW